MCDTYPSELYVPKSASPAVIVGSAKFRSRGRLPVLSYFHRDTGVSVQMVTHLLFKPSRHFAGFSVFIHSALPPSFIILCLVNVCCLRLHTLYFQASICRSSQPLSGFSARSSDDEQMLQALMKSNPVSELMYVVDTRPKVRGHENK